MAIESEVSDQVLGSLDSTFITANSFYDTLQDNLPTDNSIKIQGFDQICLGGTFDHMHSGHNLLLTHSALLTKSRMLIGVTSDLLLKKKSYASLLQTYEERCQNVRSFLKRLCGVSLQVDIFELNDPAG